MSSKWKTVPFETAEKDSKDLVIRIALSRSVERLLRSPSGLSAIVLSHDNVSSCTELTLTWKEQAIAYSSMSIVVQGSGTFSEEQHSDICELRGICDLIALPSDLADRDWNDLQFCGSLGHVGAAPSYSLFRNKSLDASSLLHGAPKQVEKPMGNLGAREMWFKTRHGTNE